MKSKLLKKELFLLYNHFIYYNMLAPFPIYCTEYIQDVKNKINEIMDNKDKDYDNEPVVACRFCKSLHIVSDQEDNNICMRCGSINELTEFENIYKYKEYLSNKNE